MTVEVEIPNGVQTQVQGSVLIVRGPQGELRRSLPDGVSLQQSGTRLVLDGSNIALLHTSLAHARNMLRGVQTGYYLKLKTIYAHFPITVEVKGTEILIKNFLGEKQVRRARLFPPTKLEAKGVEVVLKGPDKEALGLTFASMRTATRIAKKDPRVFQDGFYVIERT